MNMIKAEDVIRAIESYYEGGSLEYDGGWLKAKDAFVNKGKKESKLPISTWHTRK